MELRDERGLSIFREFSYTFLPGYDRLFVNQLQLYGADRKLKWEGGLDNFYVTSEVGDEAVSEHQVAHLPVKGLAVGDLIHLQVTRTSIDTKPWPPFIDHRASRALPVRYDQLIVLGDTSALRIEEYGAMERFNVEGGLGWRTSDPLVLRPEPHMPHYQDIGAGVMVAGSRDWAGVGTDYAALIKHQLRSAIAVREKAYDLRGSQTDIQVVIDRMVDWVRHDIRYRNVPFGGHAVIPAQAGETLRRRWGDCKDKALLLHDLLATFNIPSYLTLVNLTEPVSRELPTIQQFDHMILFIPGGKGFREQFVDLTELGGARRAVPYGLEGVYALVVQGDSSRLVTTPQVESTSEHSASLEHQVQLKEDGGAEFRDRIELQGKFAAGMREKLGGLTDKELNEAMLAWLEDELPGVTLLDLRLENEFKFAEPFVIQVTYGVEKMVAPEGNRWRFTFPAFWERNFMRMPRVAQRYHPVRLPQVMKFRSELKVKHPADWKVLRWERTPPGTTHYLDWQGDEPGTKENPLRFKAEWQTHEVFADPSEYPVLQSEWEATLRSVTPLLELEAPQR